VHRLLRSRFDTLSKAPRLHVPLLVLHSRDDELFGLAHAEALVAAAGPDAQLVVLRGGHNDAFVVSEPVYREALQAFLSGRRTGS
jgi:hypothetical protein